MYYALDRSRMLKKNGDTVALVVFFLLLLLHVLLSLFIIGNIFFDSHSLFLVQCFCSIASNADCERQHIELCSMDGNIFFFSSSHWIFWLSIAAGCFGARYEPVVSIALIFDVTGNQLRTIHGKINKTTAEMQEKMNENAHK